MRGGLRAIEMGRDAWWRLARVGSGGALKLERDGGGDGPLRVAARGDLPFHAPNWRWRLRLEGGAIAAVEDARRVPPTVPELRRFLAAHGHRVTEAEARALLGRGGGAAPPEGARRFFEERVRPGIDAHEARALLPALPAAPGRDALDAALRAVRAGAAWTLTVPRLAAAAGLPTPLPEAALAAAAEREAAAWARAALAGRDALFDLAPLSPAARALVLGGGGPFVDAFGDGAAAAWAPSVRAAAALAAALEGAARVVYRVERAGHASRVRPLAPGGAWIDSTGALCPAPDGGPGPVRAAHRACESTLAGLPPGYRFPRMPDGSVEFVGSDLPAPGPRPYLEVFRAYGLAGGDAGPELAAAAPPGAQLYEAGGAPPPPAVGALAVYVPAEGSALGKPRVARVLALPPGGIALEGVAGGATLPLGGHAGLGEAWGAALVDPALATVPAAGVAALAGAARATLDDVVAAFAGAARCVFLGTRAQLDAALARRRPAPRLPFRA